VTTTAAPPGAPPRAWARDLVRAAAAPVACAAVLIGLLSAWVSGGGAGTLSRVRIQVGRATIAMTSFTGGAAGGRTGAYLTIRNLSGTADELTGASSPAARRVILTRHTATDALGAGGGSPVASLPVAAHGTTTLSPFDSDVVLVGTGRLRAGQQVPVTLVFRDAGAVTIEATVTPPGGS
jgi:copper(I)-binding protein